MSILIKGMETPTKENVVILINPQGGVWMIGDMPNEDTHLVEAKAVSVPPHGRLGDLDELAKVVLNWITTQEKAYPNEDSNALSWRLGARAMGHQIYRDIEAAPTIVPAELPVHHGTFAAASKEEAKRRLTGEGET